MSQIKLTFDRLKLEGRKGFIPFITAGDPDIGTSLEIVLKLARCGADVIELGVPFSDPMADGPTIQRSSQRALTNGANLPAIFELVRQFRRNSNVPIVLFSYLNPLMRYGLERLTETAGEIGIDGVLVTDAVDEEAAAISELLAARGIDLISLIAPTTTDERLRNICGKAKGFVYAVSRAGVTGASSDSSNAAEHLVQRAREFTDLPIAVGFGVSTGEHIADVWRFADAAVVGSAIVAEIERSDASNVAANVEKFVRGLLPEFAKTGGEI